MPEDLKKAIIGDFEENTEEKKEVKKQGGGNESKKLILIFILLLLIIGFSLFSQRDNLMKGQPQIDERRTPQSMVKDFLDDSRTVSLEQINNVGYTFYLGQIDYKNAPPISDELKNNITQVIHRANFPKKLSKNIGIIIVNTLAVSEYKHIKTPTGNVNMPSFSPSFLTGGGAYSSKYGQMSLIFINKATLDRLSDILTHELGHYIGDQLTSSEWEKYYQLRRIPATTSRRGSGWELSPEEDFAEVYKNIFTELGIGTYYGLLKPTFFEHTCSKIYDRLMDNYKKAKYPNTSPWNIPRFITEEEANITSNTELQNCRREVLSNPEKYPSDWFGGVPYQSEVDQATKDFVVSIINRLSR